MQDIINPDLEAIEEHKGIEELYDQPSVVLCITMTQCCFFLTSNNMHYFDNYQC